MKEKLVLRAPCAVPARPANNLRPHIRVMRLAKYPCLQRADGFMCGDVWREITYIGRRTVKVRCYVNGHLQATRKGRILAQQLPINFVPGGGAA